jgi:hypothetical protein
MAVCVIAVVGVAPCQCFSPGGIQITSPGRISYTNIAERLVEMARANGRGCLPRSGKLARLVHGVGACRSRDNRPIGPPQRCARPQPAMTINVCPSGCVCHPVRAPGSNVTLAPDARAGAFAWNKGSMRTMPVNQSAGPLLEGCEPLLLISIFSTPLLIAANQENTRVNRLNHSALLRSCRAVDVSTLAFLLLTLLLVRATLRFIQTNLT